MPPPVQEACLPASGSTADTLAVDQSADGVLLVDPPGGQVAAEDTETEGLDVPLSQLLPDLKSFPAGGVPSEAAAVAVPSHGGEIACPPGEKKVVGGDGMSEAETGVNATTFPRFSAFLPHYSDSPKQLTPTQSPTQG